MSNRRTSKQSKNDNLHTSIQNVVTQDPDVKKCTYANSQHTDVFKFMNQFFEVVIKSTKLIQLSSKNAVRAMRALLNQGATLPRENGRGTEDIDAFAFMPIRENHTVKRTLRMGTPKKKVTPKKNVKKKEGEKSPYTLDSDGQINELDSDEESDKSEEEEEEEEQGKEEEEDSGGETKEDMEEQVNQFFGNYSTLKSIKKGNRILSKTDPNGELRELLFELGRIQSEDETGKKKVIRKILLFLDGKVISEHITDAIVPCLEVWSISIGNALMPSNLCEHTKVKLDGKFSGKTKPTQIHAACNNNIQAFLNGTFTALLEVVILHCFGKLIMQRIRTNSGRCTCWVSTMIFIQEEVLSNVGKLQNGYGVKLNILPFDDKGEAHALNQMIYLFNIKIADRLQHLESNGVQEGTTEYKLIKSMLESNKQQKMLVYANSHPSATSILKAYRDAQRKVKEKLSTSTNPLDKVLPQPIIEEETLITIIRDYSQISKSENKEFTKRLILSLSKDTKGAENKLEVNTGALSDDTGESFTYETLMSTCTYIGRAPHTFKKYDNSTTPSTMVQEYGLVEVLTGATGMSDDQIRKVLGNYVVSKVKAHLRYHGVTSPDPSRLAKSGGGSGSYKNYGKSRKGGNHKKKK